MSDAERGAEQRLPGRRDRADGVAGGDPGGRPEEERGLQALAADGQHRDHDERPAAALGGGVDLAAQLAADAAGGAGHPEDHPGDEADGDDRQGAADQLLRLERQAARAEGERGAERRG